MDQSNMHRVFASLERDFYSRRDCSYKIRYRDLRQTIAAADSYMDHVAMIRGPMVPHFGPGIHAGILGTVTKSQGPLPHVVRIRV